MTSASRLARSACELAALLLLAPALSAAPFVTAASAATGAPAAADPPASHRLHEPAEIMKIMENSTLTYKLGIDDSLAPARVDPPRVLSDQMQLVPGEDGGWSLHLYTLSAEGKALLDAAESAFEKKDWDGALKGYALLQEKEPAYGHVLTLIGDVYYGMGRYDQARKSFEEAIDRNFADYQAHWFLADAKWRLGDQAGAIRSLTTAHLLNVNHKAMRDSLLSYRKQAGRSWNDWTYQPRYALKKHRKSVDVSFAKEWLGYAIVKAVWAYEPGYSEGMAGPDYGKNVVTMDEEREALAAVAASNEEMKHLVKIIEDGYADELIYYEMLAPRAPEAIVLFPRPLFQRLIDYVESYH